MYAWAYAAVRRQGVKGTGHGLRKGKGVYYEKESIGDGIYGDSGGRRIGGLRRGREGWRHDKGSRNGSASRGNPRGGEAAFERKRMGFAVTVFNDYVQPNEVVESGDFDCNYFQHTPYLDSFNAERGTHLVNVGEIHYEPLGIYSGTESDLANISDGATIAIPNDTTNEARALLLLQDNGILTLKEGTGIEATKNDIAENPHNVEIVELEAAQVARVIEETSFVVLNGNYALQAGLNAQTDALVYETSDSEAAKTYVNVIVVKEGNEENAGVKALVEVLKSDEIETFIKDKYQGSVVPFN